MVQHLSPRERRSLPAFLTLASLLLLAQPVPAEWLPPFSAKCIAIIDGDTIEVLHDGETLRVRLEGIDSPEAGEAFSRKAKDYTGSVAYGKQVTVVPKERDRYGRLVARILVGETDLSVALVERGLAWHYTIHSDDQELALAESKAKTERLGIWTLPNPAPPWELEEPAQAPADTITYRGNTSSRVFHGPWCRYYTCKNCTRVFRSREAAIKAGFRPGGHCKP